MPDELQDLDTKNVEELISGVETEIEEFQPFDPEKISIDTKGITMDTCLRRLEQGTIILAPNFQRGEVWTHEKKCLLIESLMLRIPLPMFYVSADEKGVFSVVDGLQRLSTIRSFVLGDDYLKTGDVSLKGQGFKLDKLEFWGAKYNGKLFNDLPVNIYNRILETEFTFTIINPGTPEEVKRNIFKRINTGGEPLTSQEIRHALYTGKSTELLFDLSKTKEFLNATSHSVKSNRMMDRELILRFLAFTIRKYTGYPKNNDMDTFLSDTMRLINIMPNLDQLEFKKLSKTGIKVEDVVFTDIKLLTSMFKLAMSRGQAIFGEHAFRKSYEGKRRTPINKALFEVWSSLLSQLTENHYNNLLKNKKEFLKQYYKFLDDSTFNYAISRDSLKFNSVKERYDKLSSILFNFTK